MSQKVKVEDIKKVEPTEMTEEELDELLNAADEVAPESKIKRGLKYVRYKVLPKVLKAGALFAITVAGSVVAEEIKKPKKIVVGTDNGQTIGLVPVNKLDEHEENTSEPIDNENSEE